jgi:hypothetical protein
VFEYANRHWAGHVFGVAGLVVVGVVVDVVGVVVDVVGVVVDVVGFVVVVVDVVVQWRFFGGHLLPDGAAA